tara:strand:+ start:865 stop:1260 length:396 start_codon:yes stop_codon:yes gene_type:complete
MTSELRVDTLKDASGNNSIAMSMVFGGTAKAWANQDGTADDAAARDSFNISGIVDTSAGNYTLSFSSNMSSANWTSQISANNGTTDVSGAHDYGFAVVDRAAGSYRVDIENASNSQTDLSLVDTVVHGDLA